MTTADLSAASRSPQPHEPERGGYSATIPTRLPAACTETEPRAVETDVRLLTSQRQTADGVERTRAIPLVDGFV